MAENERKDELSHEEWDSIHVELWGARAGHESPMDLIHKWERAFTPRLFLEVFSEAIRYSG